MRKFSLWLPQIYVVASMLMALTAIAETPTPPKEFWDYVEEFGDDKGNVLDPLDYDEILNLKENQEAPAVGAMPKDNPDAQNASNAKHIDMKVEQKSFARASSAVMKGEGQ
ncbi:MAG: hypothetical protein EOO53_09860 [Gammaproteobacteria bacterium]|nr:MAG: hypothetical protein EOO53_09860 [Gammaproteobacteria bacterium]